MQIVYIAHPISGDVAGNLEKIKNIAIEIVHTNFNVIPFVPYWFACHVLDDSIEEQRARGILWNVEFFKRNHIDAVWLYGDRISKGMQAEIELAREQNIPVVFKSEALRNKIIDFINNGHANTGK